MGAAASVIEDNLPAEISERKCRELTGACFDERLFRNSANNSVVSREKLYQIAAARTDCFLTHDWGNERGQDNHARVACVNTVLQKRGLKTWFDAEQMQGNIKKQMISGIDNAQCIVVFVTQRYIEKVAGNNAEDNCQLEFNYAARTKTAARMVAVVMEERVRNASMWKGEVGMVLGGSLYVDMCGDLSDVRYLDAKTDELEKAILRVVGTPVAKFQWCVAAGNTGGDGANVSAMRAAVISQTSTANVSKASTASTGAENKPLSSLSIQEVGCLLESLNLGAYVRDLANNDIDGPCLDACESVEDVKEMGIAMKVKAKILYGFIETSRATGVPRAMVEKAGQGTACTALAATSQPVSSDAALVNPGQVNLLEVVRLLSGGTPAERDKAAATIRSLAADAINNRLVVAPAAIAPIVTILKEGTADTKAHAALAISIISGAQANKQSVVAAGCLPPLVSLLKDGSDISRECAANALSSIIIEGACRSHVVAAGAIPPLVQALQDSVAGVQWHAISALRGLALGAVENRKVIAAAGAIPPLVGLLSSNSSETATNAAWTLTALATDNPENKTAIALAGAILPLVQLVKGGSDFAALAICILAADVDNQKEIAAADGIAPLVLMLTGGSADAKESAASALWNLAFNQPENQRAIAKAGGIPALVALLKDGTASAKEKAVGALGRLAADPANAKSIAAAKGLPPIIQLLTEGSADAQQQAAYALWNLALDARCKWSIAAAHGIPALVHVLRNGPAQVKENASGALANLADDAECKKSIATAKGILPLVQLLADGSECAKENAARALWNLASDASNKKAIAAAGGIPLLTELLKNGSVGGKENAAGALGVLGASA